MSDYDEFEIATRAVRAGQQRTAEGEHSEAIFPTSSYVFASAAQAAARFSGDQPGNIYSRFTNPTVRTFEERLASMEGAERCVATASGMAAILATCAGLLKAGDHIVSSHSIFGTTIALFSTYLARFGIETTFVPLANTDRWEAAIRPDTRLLFLETPSNPLTEIADIKRLSALAKSNDCVLVVDNCFCTPILNSHWRSVRISSFTRQPSTWTARGAVSVVRSSVTTNWLARKCMASCVPPGPA